MAHDEDYSVKPRYKPFDFIKAINDKNYNYNSTITNKEYSQYVINLGFSFFPDTVMLANEMNRLRPDNHQHYDFLYYAISKKRRYSPWYKKEKNGELVLEVAEYYDVSVRKAADMLRVMKQEDVDNLKEQFTKGGNSGK